MKKILTTILIIVLAIPCAFAGASKEAKSDEIRIVSLAPNVTEIIYALNMGDHLVGRTDYCDFPDDALKVPSIGTLWEPNIEAIIALNPTIVISSSIVDPTVTEALAKAGINAKQFYMEETTDGTYKIIEEVGRLIGKEEEGKALAAKVKARIDAVREKTSSIPMEKRKHVMYFVGWGEWGDYSAAGGTYLDEILVTAGGINDAAENPLWALPKEVIVAKNPQVVLISAYDYTDRNAELNAFLSTAPYSNLKASLEHQVWFIDGNAMERQGLRSADAVEEIAAILYPELFK